MIDRAPTADDARDLIAAEYVLGLTEPHDLAQVEAFIMRDSNFAASVAAWRARLAPLDGTAQPAASASEAVWTRIEAGLGDKAAKPAMAEATAEPAPQVASPPPAVAPAVPAIEPRRPAAPRPVVAPSKTGLWHSLAFWRFAGLSGAFAAMILGVGLAYFAREASRQPTLIAVLMSPDGNQAAAVVNAFADGRAELVPLVNFDVPPGKAIEIWTLWDRAVGPRSIGLIQRAARTTLNLQGLPLTKAGQLFEMTLEPATGSPTGRPTGPILNKGETTQAL